MAHTILNLTFPSRKLARTVSSRLHLALALFASAVLCAGSLHAEERASVRKVPPTYPPIARQMHIIGVIRVVATVGPSGSVIAAESTSGNKLLATAAIEAVKQWKFVPGPEQSTVTVSVEFQ